MNTLGIILVSIIAIGGLISILRIKEGQIPKSRVAYRLRVIDIIARLYLSVPFFILMILTLYLLLSRIFIDSMYYAFGLFLPIILGFLSIPPLIVFYQYFKVENGRIIEFDLELRQMIIKTKKKRGLLKMMILNSLNILMQPQIKVHLIWNI